MLDMHVHVWPHVPGTPLPTFEMLDRYCEAAVSRGIAQLAITEHSHRFTRIGREVLPHWRRPQVGVVADATAHVLDAEGGADLDGYVEVLTTARDRGLPLLVGLEVDYLPGAMAAMAAVLDDYPFDVLLGSVHWLDEWLFDAYDSAAFAKRWSERDVDDVYAQYVDSVIELAQSGLVDVLAHLDVVKVAGYLPARPSEHEDRLVAALLETEVVIEVSSAGFRKPANDSYPSLRLLRRLVDGGLGVTTASDAHVVEQIGDGFDQLRELLDQTGVSRLVSFDRRSRLPVSRT